MRRTTKIWERSPVGARHVVVVLALSLTSGSLLGEIIDGVAAVVGSSAITHSEIDHELRLEALFNMIEFDSSRDSRRAALERLIERRLVHQDLDLAAFLVADPEEVDERMTEYQATRFLGGRDLSAALRHYSLSESHCREFVSEQISLERYIAFRFQTGLDATDEEIATYYETVYRPRRESLGATLGSLDDISEEIKAVLIELQADQLLDERVRELRALTRIEVLAKELESTP